MTKKTHIMLEAPSNLVDVSYHHASHHVGKVYNVYSRTFGYRFQHRLHSLDFEKGIVEKVLSSLTYPSTATNYATLNHLGNLVFKTLDIARV